MIRLATVSLLAVYSCPADGLSLSPPPLCVAAADEKSGLGTSRMSGITLERIGWAQDAPHPELPWPDLVARDTRGRWPALRKTSRANR